MRLKIFQAPSVSLAMAKVRDELGPDALILQSRTLEDGVELTAAAEDANEAEPPPKQLWAHEADLRWHGVPPALAAKLAADELIAALDREIKFAELPCSPGSAPLLLVGPPGAGKTTTTARLATRLTLAGQPTHVITTDGRRAGAAEQLAAFTRLLQLTLIVADAPSQLPRALARCEGTMPILIDTPGLDPATKADRQFLQECRAATGGTVALVLPVGLDPNEAEDVARGFLDMGATLLVATRLDQSRRLGGILAAAACGLALTDAGIGPGIADSLATMSPSFLADRLGTPKQPPRERTACPNPSPLERLIKSGSQNQRTAS